jgi:hypothetical protein
MKLAAGTTREYLLAVAGFIAGQAELVHVFLTHIGS